MEQQWQRENPKNQPVIGAQCSRPQLISGKTYTRTNYPDTPLIQSWESYTREQSLGSRNDIETSKAEARKTEDPNKVIQEKSDSNIPFIMNSKELESCQTAEQTINVLTGFMSAGFDDFEKRTGRRPTYGEMREMYG